MRRPKEPELTKEQKVICKLLGKWNKIIDDPKKRKQANKIFDLIWKIKDGKVKIP